MPRRGKGDLCVVNLHAPCPRRGPATSKVCRAKRFGRKALHAVGNELDNDGEPQ